MLDYFSNHIIIAFLLVILSCGLVVLINLLLIYSHIRTAVRKFVKPELEKNGLTYIDYKWTGFWGSGDFKDKIEFALFKTGWNTTSVYSFIYYKNARVTKRVTIKINLINLIIDKVLYSNEL